MYRYDEIYELISGCKLYSSDYKWVHTAFLEEENKQERAQE